ncbi:unnamed protein product, partial [Meganyctiphanes norvegica]
MPFDTEASQPDYRIEHKKLKRMVFLSIMENECFQEELRKAQRAVLRVRRDKSFLLDRLLQYQRGPDSSSDSEQTEESDLDNDTKIDNKRKRISVDGSNVSGSGGGSQGSTSKPSSKKKKPSSGSGGGSGASASSSSGGRTMKHIGGKQVGSLVLGGSMVISSSSGSGGGSSGGVQSAGGNVPPGSSTSSPQANQRRMMAGVALAALQSSHPGGVHPGIVSQSDGQLSREEVERRLAARQSINDFTTTVSLTLPNQLFSDNLMEGGGVSSICNILYHM